MLTNLLNITVSSIVQQCMDLTYYSTHRQDIALIHSEFDFPPLGRFHSVSETPETALISFHPWLFCSTDFNSGFFHEELSLTAHWPGLLSPSLMI